RIGEVLPGASHAFHVGLAAEFAFGAHFASHASHFGGEGGELVHHGVDGDFQLENFAFHIDGDLLGEVAIGHGGGHGGDVSHLCGDFTGHSVYGVGQVLPGAGDTLHLGLPAQFTLGAHFAGHASYFGRERRKLIHHRIDYVLDLEDFALHID